GAPSTRSAACRRTSRPMASSTRPSTPSSKPGSPARSTRRPRRPNGPRRRRAKTRYGTCSAKTPVPSRTYLEAIHEGLAQEMERDSSVMVLGEDVGLKGGDFGCPIVIRTPFGGGVHGALYHSQSVEAFYAHVPGLKVVIPSIPYDAKGLLVSAIRDPDPVMFFEHKRLYRLLRDEVPDDLYTVPIGP